MLKREEKRLLVFERKDFCMIYDPKIVDVVYRSRYNFSLDREFNSPNVIEVVKSNRLRYAWYVKSGVEDLSQTAV
jgi:hypothetical protein